MSALGRNQPKNHSATHSTSIAPVISDSHHFRCRIYRLQKRLPYSVAPSNAPTGGFGEGAAALRCGRDLRRSYSGPSARAATECRGSVRRYDTGALERSRNRWDPAFAGRRGLGCGSPIARDVAVVRKVDGPTCRGCLRSRGLSKSTKAPGGAFVVDQGARAGFAAFIAILRDVCTSPCRCGAAAVTSRRRPSPFPGTYWNSPIRCRTRRPV